MLSEGKIGEELAVKLMEQVRQKTSCCLYIRLFYPLYLTDPTSHDGSSRLQFDQVGIASGYTPHA
jgi:hypothetical protein